MGYRAIGPRLNRALAGFKASFWLSLFGTVIEAVVLAVTYNIILFADLAHWLIDTVLEGLFMVSVNHASKTYRRFPLGTLVLESMLVTAVATAMIGVYGYVFVNYFINYGAQGVEGVYHPLMALVTALGGVLTGAVVFIQRKKYNELKLEIIRVDYHHAILDTVAAAFATAGVIVVSYTGNHGYEALFTAVLTLFIFHSVFEIFSDTFKTVTGRNVEPYLKLRVFEKLIRSLEGVHVRSVDARKIGSFYIVSVHVEVNPRTTIMEAYRLRTRIIELVREVNDLIYHVDVSIAPHREVKRKHR